MSLDFEEEMDREEELEECEKENCSECKWYKMEQMQKRIASKTQ